jgi:site-specific DNA recombinase
MKAAAIYCRVSTDNQETEGTSLHTQLDACLKYCQDKGYDVRHRFSEAYSGLILERPKLNELRELVRAGEIDVIVVYCLDRLSRDPTHGVILIQELEKHGVKLEAVTEDIDNSELGKLISYIRGYASKLEAEKIRERTMRGKLAKAQEGQVFGGLNRTYGYDYIKKGQKDGGRRTVNETEAPWVKKIFEWCVDEGLATGAIRDKLTANNAPTRLGGPWRRASVLAILKNPAYTGKTYAFASTKGRLRKRPKEEWIELSDDITPAIISQELFDAAQKQLRVNYNRASRNNTVRQYLLRSHIRCRQCGYAYVGGGKKRKDGSYNRVYACSCKSRDKAPLQPCRNKNWGADKLESMVWTELERYLGKPELIINELEKQRQDANQLGAFETELQQIERQLKVVDRDQHQLLQWALKGFPESQVESENKRLNKARETLTARRTELQTQIKACQDTINNVPNLEAFIERIQTGIGNLDFQGKCLVLDTLNITVWIDGESIEVTGTIPVENGDIVTTSSRALWPVR